MSIASRITSIEGHIEEDYNALERLGADLTGVNKNIENIASVVNDIYDKLPKVTGTGSDLSLTPTLKGGMNILPLGNAEQDTITYINVGTWEQGGIDYQTGNNDPSNTSIRTDFIEVKPNILYNLTRSVSTGVNAFRFYNSNKAYIGYQSVENITTNQSSNRMDANVTSMTMTIINTSIAYMRIVDLSNDLSTQYTISTQAPTPDYPKDIRVVTGDNQVVVQNKNFLPFTNQDFTINDVRFKCENGRLKINGTSSGNVWNNNSNLKNNFNFILPAGTYYFARGVEVNSYIRDYNNDTTLVQNNGSFTLETPTKVYFSVYFTTGTSFVNLVDTAQLEKGSTYSESIPHAEQTYTLHLGTNYLAGIGTYKDEIVGKTDDWKIKRYVGKKIANNITTTGTANVHIDTTFNDYLNQNGLCNYLTNKVDSRIVGNYDAGVYLENNEFTFRDGTTKDRLYIKSTLTATELNALEMSVYYILATPTEIPITDTSLVQSLNELNDLMSYDGTTNIVITSNSANAQLTAQISALKGE